MALLQPLFLLSEGPLIGRFYILSHRSTGGAVAHVFLGSSQLFPLSCQQNSRGRLDVSKTSVGWRRRSNIFRQQRQLVATQTGPGGARHGQRVVHWICKLQPRRGGSCLDEPHVEWRVVEEDWSGCDEGEKGFHCLGQGTAFSVYITLSDTRQLGDW